MQKKLFFFKLSFLSLPFFKNKGTCVISPSCPGWTVANSLLARQPSVGKRREGKAWMVLGCQEKASESVLAARCRSPCPGDTAAGKCYPPVPPR